MTGYKTYVVGAGMIAYAVIGFALGKVDGNSAIQTFLGALAVMGLRSAVTTEVSK